MDHITSRTNALITRIRKLVAERKHRRREGVMVCEGPKMLGEALRWGAALDTVVWEAGKARAQDIPDGVRQVEVPGDLLAALAPTQTPQGVLFLCQLPERALPEKLEGRRYLVLDGVQDPGNVGTLWRTADAFGADGMILLPGCADPWSPKPLRATMGACFRLPVWEGALGDPSWPRRACRSMRPPCGRTPWTCGRWICAAAPSPSAARGGASPRRCWRPAPRP